MSRVTKEARGEIREVLTRDDWRMYVHHSELTALLDDADEVTGLRAETSRLTEELRRCNADFFAMQDDRNGFVEQNQQRQRVMREGFGFAPEALWCDFDHVLKEAVAAFRRSIADRTALRAEVARLTAENEQLASIRDLAKRGQLSEYLDRAEKVVDAAREYVGGAVSVTRLRVAVALVDALSGSGDAGGTKEGA